MAQSRLANIKQRKTTVLRKRTKNNQTNTTIALSIGTKTTIPRASTKTKTFTTAKTGISSTMIMDTKVVGITTNNITAMTTTLRTTSTLESKVTTLRTGTMITTKGMGRNTQAQRSRLTRIVDTKTPIAIPVEARRETNHKSNETNSDKNNHNKCPKKWPLNSSG
jgi:hypothetical protein